MSLVEKWNRVLSKCEKTGNYQEIISFLTSTVYSPLFKLHRLKILEIIPDVVAHTNGSNLGWLDFEQLRTLDGFPNAVKKGLYKTDMYLNGLNYFTFLSKIADLNIWDEELVNHLVSINLTTEDITYIVRLIYDYNLTIGDLFVTKLINEKSEECVQIADILIDIISFCYVKNGVKHISPIEKNIDFFIHNMEHPFALYEIIKKDNPSIESLNEYISNNFNKFDDDVMSLYWTRDYKKITDRVLLDKIDEYLSLHFNEIIIEHSFRTIMSELIDELSAFPSCEKKRKEYIENHFNEVIDDIYTGINFKDNDLTREQEIERKAMIDFIRIVFDEVCQNEGITYGDILFIGSGSYTSVYRVGDKVIKVGFSRETKQFNNNPYIVAPLLRKNYYFDGNVMRESIFVEVTEYVDTVENDEVSEEELYQLYSNLRNLGLEWLDVAARNVGRLRRDNIIHWQNDLKPTDNSLGLDSKLGEDINLKAGDLVIIDSDYIYGKDLVPENLIKSLNDDDFTNFSLWKKFYKRYNSEHGIKRGR